MNEEAEKSKLREVHKLYTSKVTHLWNDLLKKYKFDEQTGISIIANFWYEPDNAEKFEDEWMENTDLIRNILEKQFDVVIEHEEEMIVVKNDNFVYDGVMVIEEDKDVRKSNFDKYFMQFMHL